MANYLPVALANSAKNWLVGLPRGSIRSWGELHDHFVANFQGTFERPGTHFELYNVIQKPDESLSDYIRRFSEKRNNISNIIDDNILLHSPREFALINSSASSDANLLERSSRCMKKPMNMPRRMMRSRPPSSWLVVGNPRKTIIMELVGAEPTTRIASASRRTSSVPLQISNTSGPDSILMMR